MSDATFIVETRLKCLDSRLVSASTGFDHMTFAIPKQSLYHCAIMSLHMGARLSASGLKKGED